MNRINPDIIDEASFARSSMRIIVGALCLSITLCLSSLWAQDKGIETGIEDDLTVKGQGGSKADPDFEAWGFSAFGTNYNGASFATSGVGNVFIQNHLEVGSNLYLRGVGLIFPDNTTQTTAQTSGSLTENSTLVSGECDTNRLDILFSTNFLITAVKVFQSPAISQDILIYTNTLLVDTFSLAGPQGSRSLSFELGAYDRLGIACTNRDGTVLFSFEGRKP